MACLCDDGMGSDKVGLVCANVWDGVAWIKGYERIGKFDYGRIWTCVDIDS